MKDRAFVFGTALVCAIVFWQSVKLSCTIIGGDRYEAGIIGLTTIVTYWRLLDKGDEE